MEKNELISIIMPAYNAGKYIKESIESVLAQTYQNWELIIVDDGSTDNTKEVVDHFLKLDRRVQYLWQANGKQGRARNAAIKRSRGGLLAFLDADDYWMKEKLDKQIAKLNQSGADLVFTDVIVIDHEGNIINDSCSVTDGSIYGKSGIISLYRFNPVPILSVMVKKSAVLNVGCFREEDEIQNIEDYELWLRLLHSNYKFVSIGQILGAYRRHDSQTVKGKHSIMKILNMLSEIRTKDKDLTKQKKRAMKLWTVRCLKTAVDSSELDKLISLYPDYFGKIIFPILSQLLSFEIMKKVVYYSSKDNLLASGFIYFKTKMLKPA